MRRQMSAVIIAAMAATSVGVAVPAAGAAKTIKAKPGQYALNKTPMGYPRFTLNKKRTEINPVYVNGYIATACQASLTQGYSVATAGTKVKKNHFSESSTSYGGLKVRVTFKGHWTSPTVVHAVTVVTYKAKKYKHCDATLPYTFVWVSA